MHRFSKVAVAAACALGMSATMAQSVERDGKVVSKTAPQQSKMAQAQTAAPVQVAQAGGAAGGASTSGVAAGTGGLTLGTVVAVGVGLAVIAVAADSDSAVSH